ncbi:MAG: DUF169 domain-containing protein [Deltaproteobacteria bacterium]|jgi:hypothetical protein|nr:DUF169 domain-containing protein [Deltaproteobacteria bacterium]
MESKTAAAVKLKHRPLGLWRSDEAPAGARQYTLRTKYSPSSACSMSLIEMAFAKGVPCSFSTGTVHCPGAVNGFGLARPPWPSPGGMMGNLRLVSNGNRSCEEGRAAIEELRSMGASRGKLEQFAEGEGFKKDPETLMKSFESLPRIPPVEGFVNYAPLADLSDPPEAVIFLADPQQLTALTVLAGYALPHSEAVTVPFVAACGAVGALPLAESLRPVPRAVIGLADVTMRKVMRRLVGRNLVTFSAPWRLYSEMEGNIEESFITRPDWRSIA